MDVVKLAGNQRFPDAARVFACIVRQKLLKGHQGVGMAAVGNLPVLEQRHKPVARTALPVACRAEGGDITHAHQPTNHLVKRALIADVKLLAALVLGLRLAITAHTGARSAADLRYAKADDLFTHSLAFARGDNHARVGNRYANQGAYFGEGSVVDAVVKYIGVDIVGVLDARHADGMRPNAVHGLQMLGMHQKRGKLIFI